VSHPESARGSLPVRALGTRGELEWCLRGSLGASTRDTWRTRTVYRRVSRREHSGHVANSNGVPEGLLARALGTRSRGTEMEAGTSSPAAILVGESSARLGEVSYALGARR